MRPILAIARQQVSRAFGQPLAWVVLIGFVGWLALTTLWVDDVLAAGVPSMRRPFFWMAAAFTVLAPALTMRTLAAERQAGTLQILGTWPVTSAELVVGKWLGSTALLGMALGLTVSWPLGLGAVGSLDPGPVLAGYAGLLLFGGACTAVGTAASAWTRHQVLAFLVALSALALPWVVGVAFPSLPPALAWAEWLTPQHHLDQLIRGIVDTRTLAVLAAVVAVALRIGVLALERERLA